MVSLRSGDLGHQPHLLLIIGEIEQRSGFAGNGGAACGGLGRNRSQGGNGDLARARKIEAAQNGAGLQRVGPEDVDQKLHQGIADAFELAREFVDGRLERLVHFARQHIQPFIRQRIVEPIESLRQAGGFGFGENLSGGPRAGRYGGQRTAQHLLVFVLHQARKIFREIGDGVALREHHVDREVGAEGFAHHAQALLQAAAQSAHAGRIGHAEKRRDVAEQNEPAKLRIPLAAEEALDESTAGRSALQAIQQRAPAAHVAAEQAARKPPRTSYLRRTRDLPAG